MFVCREDSLQRRHTQNNDQCSVQQSWGPEYSSVLWRYFIKCPIICAYPGVPWIRRQDWACGSLVRRGKGPAQRHWSRGRGHVAGGYQGSPHLAVSQGTGCQSELWRGRGSPTIENKHSTEKLKCIASLFQINYLRTNFILKQYMTLKQIVWNITYTIM